MTESVPKPLDSIVIRYFLSQKRETSDIDFKLTIDISRNADFGKMVKDIFAISNYGVDILLSALKRLRQGAMTL